MKRTICILNEIPYGRGNKKGKFSKLKCLVQTRYKRGCGVDVNILDAQSNNYILKYSTSSKSLNFRPQD